MLEKITALPRQPRWNKGNLLLRKAKGVGREKRKKGEEREEKEGDVSHVYL